MPQTKTIFAGNRSRSIGVLAQLRATVTTALTRRRERAMLSRLDAHLLRDMGIDPHAATTEARKPFWQP